VLDELTRAAALVVGAIRAQPESWERLKKIADDRAFGEAQML
jgi:hypothetical protein